jgi:hypothetical protein
MHLVGPELTTNKSRKRKKYTTTQLHKKYDQDFRDYNKDMQRLGAKLKTFDEYVDYREGRGSYKKRLVTDPMKATTWKRPSPEVPSGIGMAHVTGKVEKVYTGDYIKGVSTMHKSNMVPVTSQEQIEDISKMRRN